MQIGFTDRYGGRPPSWLRGCHGDCEAMGWVPLMSDLGLNVPMAVRPAEPLTRDEMLAWNAAHVAAGKHECDGWHFVKCWDCGGSGRVSWLVTLTRVPRWLVKGVRFYGWAMQPEISPPDWTWRQRFANYLNAAFLSDLKGLRR